MKYIIFLTLIFVSHQLFSYSFDTENLKFSIHEVEAYSYADGSFSTKKIEENSLANYFNGKDNLKKAFLSYLSVITTIEKSIQLKLIDRLKIDYIVSEINSFSLGNSVSLNVFNNDLKFREGANQQNILNKIKSITKEMPNDNYFQKKVFDKITIRILLKPKGLNYAEEDDVIISDIFYADSGKRYFLSYDQFIVYYNSTNFLGEATMDYFKDTYKRSLFDKFLNNVGVLSEKLSNEDSKSRNNLTIETFAEEDWKRYKTKKRKNEQKRKANKDFIIEIKKSLNHK